MRGTGPAVTAGIYCIDAGFALQWQGMRLHHRVFDRGLKVERVELSPSTFAARFRLWLGPSPGQASHGQVFPTSTANSSGVDIAHFDDTPGSCLAERVVFGYHQLPSSTTRQLLPGGADGFRYHQLPLYQLHVKPLSRAVFYAALMWRAAIGNEGPWDPTPTQNKFMHPFLGQHAAA